MKQFSLFLLSGGIAALLNWSSRFIFSIWMSFETAIIASFFVGLLSGYLIMRIYVFDGKNKPILPQASKYIIINAIALVQTLIISIILVRWVFPAWEIFSHQEALAHFIGILVPIISSYFGHKLFTFK